MHANSLSAYHEEKAETLTPREKLIWKYLLTHGPRTARQVAMAFGKSDMNWARPRITELVNNDWAVETGSVECQVTHKKVRLTQALTPEQRDERIAAREAAGLGAIRQQGFAF